MYRITAENDGKTVTLHTPGVNSAQRLRSGTMKEQVSQIPSFSFTITPANQCYYGNLYDRKTIITVTNTRTGEAEFEGTLLTSEECMTAAGVIYTRATCEGFMGYLCDSVQMYCHYEEHTPSQFLFALLENHNAQVPEEKRIYLGICNIEGNTNSKTTAYRNTLEEIKENLISRLGGEIRVRRQDGKLYLDYLDAATNGTTSGTVIELAHNMKSLSKGSDSTSVITRLIPLGHELNDGSAERLTIEDAVVEGQRYGKVYIDDENAIAAYGIIVGTVEFDDITVPENLYASGAAYMQENNRIRHHYEAVVLDLSAINSHVAGLRAGNTYRFVNKFLKLDEMLRIIKRTVDINKPYAPTVEIGDKTQKITDVIVRNTRMIEYELPQQRSEILSTAKSISTALITAATTGYVVIRPDEILIMDTDDTATATSVWRFNSGGIGYSHSDVPGEAYNGEYGIAMTMNGQIVADFIAAGSMYADRIRGGTLTVGGADGKDGVIQVLDDNGTEICRLDKNGASIFGSVVSRNEQDYWVKIDNGSLTGGRGNDTYATVNATAEIYDGDNHVTYKGLLLDGGAIALRCNMLAVNGGTGVTGGAGYVSGVRLNYDAVEVVTDCWIDENGALQKNTAWVSAITDWWAASSTIYYRNGLMVTGLG